jgi:hypothetical protein
MNEMLLYCRKKHLLASLYLFVCRFISVDPISWISLKAYIGDFRENLFGKPSFVKIGQKYRSVTWRREYASLYSATLYHHKFSALQRSWICLFIYRRSTNIWRTRYNITYNVTCRLVWNWPAVELVTFVCCIYQHKRSIDWSVFLLPDGVTLDGMPHRRNYTIFLYTSSHEGCW